MKRKLVKATVIVSAFMMLTMGLTGCKKKTECDFCGEMKKCSEETFFGETVNICGDCEKDLEAFGSMFQ